MFQRGWYLNDLYMYVTSTMIDRHDKDFRVDVCPYEGGSDHSVFLKSSVPALLTWHFTDYTYHTSSDTLYMASPRELESVGITTLVSALMISDSQGDAAAAADVLGAVKEAGLKRMESERVNTDHHLVYAKAGHTTLKKALINEEKVLNAWGTWYDQAISSIAELYGGPNDDVLTAAISKARTEVLGVDIAVSQSQPHNIILTDLAVGHQSNTVLHCAAVGILALVNTITKFHKPNVIFKD